MKTKLFMMSLAALFACTGCSDTKQQWTAEHVTTLSGFNVPECTLYDPAKALVYVTNMDCNIGEYWTDDGKGYLSILGKDLSYAVVADIFCGTGSLGLEAVSRGAKHAVMVDMDRDAILRLKKNITRCEFDDATTIIRTEVPATHAWKKTYNGSDITKLVPTKFANSGNVFYNEGTEMEIQNSSGQTLTKNKPFAVLVDVCDPTMPETNCTYYPTTKNSKPEGLLQRYHDKMLFGLMTYSHDKADRGGILRTPIQDISNFFNWDTNGGDNSSSASMLTYLAT